MPPARDQRFAAHGRFAERQRDALQRLAFEAAAERLRPIDEEAAVGRRQRRDGDAPLGEQRHPIAGRAEPRPACAAERQHGRVGGDGLLLAGRGRTAAARHRPSRASGGACGTRRPRRASRASQARSSGEAFMATGNTRPLEPTKVGWPSASHQARTASGGNASMAGRSCSSPRRSAAESAPDPRYG